MNLDKAKSDPVLYAAEKKRNRERARIKRGTPTERFRGEFTGPMTEAERKEKERAYNHRPDVAAKRKAFYKHRRLNDPVWAAEQNRIGVERFKAKKSEIYKYRKEVRSVWAKEDDRKYIREWQRNRRQTDPQYRIGNRLRSRMWHAVEADRGRKAAKTESLTGCTVAKLRIHLESKFTKGMSWANIGEWHIDHIVPCAKFDLTKETEQRKCFHFSNLRPLWRAANQAKRDRIEPCQPELLLVH